MEKILSVCIPSYNMEGFLGRCVDSMLVSEVLDKLEIIIVNDGSKDETLSIANNYKQKYPNSIIIIDKPNGHYGSCVNEALKVATGKYFRIVDADDWVDSESFKKMIVTALVTDVDVFFTKCMDCDFKINQQIPRKYTDIIYDTILDLNEYRVPECLLSMHSLTYRTQLLKDINYKQTEGICYTDTEYVCFPMCQARTLYAMNNFLYQYYIGRDDQSMAFNSIERNLNHTYPLIKRFSEDKSYLKGNKNSKFIHDHFIEVSATQLYIYSIIFCRRNKERETKNRYLLSDIKEKNKEAFDIIINIKAKNFIPYIKIWYYHPILSYVLRCGKLFL